VTAATTALAGAFAHPALLYRGEDEYLTATVPFVRAGLAAGEPVAVAVPGPHLALLRAHLGDDTARVTLVDMGREGRNPGRIIPAVLHAFADAHHGAPARIVSEPLWAGRTAAEYPACVRHEALINLAFAGRRATILCPYDVGRLPPAWLADAAATHPVLVDGTGRRDSDGYAPERILRSSNEPLTAPPTARVYRFDRSSSSQVRRAASAAAERAGVPARRVHDVAVVFSELASNSVVHGGGEGVLRLWHDDTHFVGEVSDAGRLTDPLAGRLPIAADDEGGRGLLLVNLLADLVRVHLDPAGTTTRVHFAHAGPGTAR
jgi:anti-sigma regulatory factor (Ser/Thr protein kinase)